MMKWLMKRLRCGVILMMIHLLFVTVLMPTRTANSADPPQNVGYFFDQAVSFNPTIHDIGERIRIAKGIDPDRVAEFTGMHEAVSFPGDAEPDGEDFREESLGQLRSEIRMACAELSSVRSQIEEVRRIVELLRQLVESATTLYGNGRLDQAQALKAQLEWEKQSELLNLLGKREKIFSVRLNVLAGINPNNPVPQLEPLPEYTPNFSDLELIRSYKSRRFLELFQRLIKVDSSQVSNEDVHSGDSLDVEATAFISVVRISLKSLSERIRHYRTALVPKAEQAHAVRLELYRNGKIDIAALLEGLVMLADLRREYRLLIGETHLLKARVEYVTGMTLE